MTTDPTTPRTLDDLNWTRCVSDVPPSRLAGFPAAGLLLVRHTSEAWSVVDVAMIRREGWGCVTVAQGPVQDWILVDGAYAVSDDAGLDESGQDWHDSSLDATPSSLVH